MILLSYIIVAFIDTKAFTKLKEKGILPLYIILMLISYAIGTTDVYVKNMPSPAGPIRDFITSIIGG